MKKRIVSVALMIATAALLTVPLQSAEAQMQICGTPTQVNLLAGQTIHAGTVTVGNDGTYLYVVFDTSDGWTLTETHVAVSTTVDGIPQTKTGNPIPGQFDYSAEHQNATTYVCVIALSDLGLQPGSSIVIAAHSIVTKAGSGGKGGTQTAWGEGPQFRGKNWAMYINYVTQSCNEPT